MFAYAGIDYSSPTLATAMGNLIPAFTFVFAVIFRWEPHFDAGQLHTYKYPDLCTNDTTIDTGDFDVVGIYCYKF